MYVQMLSLKKDVVSSLMNAGAVGRYVQTHLRDEFNQKFVDHIDRKDKKWVGISPYNKRSVTAYHIEPPWQAGLLLVAKDKGTMARAFARVLNRSVSVTGCGALVMATGPYSGKITSDRVDHALWSPIMIGRRNFQREGLEHSGYCALLTGQMLLGTLSGMSLTRVGDYEATFETLHRHLLTSR